MPTHRADRTHITAAPVCTLCRWFYFFAAWPTLFVCVSFLTNKLFSFIEWWFYREALFYLDSVRRTARGLLFMSLVSL